MEPGQNEIRQGHEGRINLWTTSNTPVPDCRQAGTVDSATVFPRQALQKRFDTRCKM